MIDVLPAAGRRNVDRRVREMVVVPVEIGQAGAQIQMFDDLELGVGVEPAFERTRRVVELGSTDDRALKLDAREVVIEAGDVHPHPAVEQFAFQPDLVGVQLFRIDRGIGRRDGVVLAALEATAVLDVAEDVGGELVVEKRRAQLGLAQLFF